MRSKITKNGFLSLLVLITALTISGCTTQKDDISTVAKAVDFTEVQDLLVSGVIVDIETEEVLYTIGDVTSSAEVNSALKPYVAAKLMDMGKISADTLVDDTPFEIGDSTIRCWIYPKEHGGETFEQSIIQSCRPPLARVAADLSSKEVQEIFEPLDITVSDALTQEEMAQMAVGSTPEFSTEQLAKAYGSLAQENEKLCSIMGEIAKQKIGSVNSSLGMAKGRGESNSIRETEGHGHEIDTIVLLWPIDSPQICCALQYPWDKEDEIYKWIENLELTQ